MHTLHRTFFSTMVIAGCVIIFSHSSVSAQPGEQVSTLQTQKSVAITIYNNDLALIKDMRHIDRLPQGDFNLAWRDVSAQMRPETALLRSMTHPDSITITEQNFDFDLLTPRSLLDKYVGKTVSIVSINPATGVESKENALVLSTSDGVVLKMADRVETGMPGRIIFDSIPHNLRDRPTLVISGSYADNKAQDFELSYLTGGLSWKADYVAELNEHDDRLDLSGWVTLTNTSGTSYPNATLQLVAGDVNRIQRESAASMTLRAKAMADVAAASMQQEALMEYHLYSLNRLTTIAENQTKQIALLNATHIPVSKELVLMGSDHYYITGLGDLGQKLKVSVFLQFDNKEASQLGIPLPQGIVRVYKQDKTGNAQFVGEDHIDHTPKNEKVRLKLGQSFDVTANKKQIDFKQLSSSVSVGRFESAYEITLKNARKETVTVTVQEPVPGEWRILEENFPHQKTASNTAVWKISIPSEGETTLKYRVQAIN